MSTGQSSFEGAPREGHSHEEHSREERSLGRNSFEGQTLGRTKCEYHPDVGELCYCEQSQCDVTPINDTDCVNINECNEHHLCDQVCIDTPGSYYCSCNPGFQLDTRTTFDPQKSRYCRGNCISLYSPFVYYRPIRGQHHCWIQSYIGWWTSYIQAATAQANLWLTSDSQA